MTILVGVIDKKTEQAYLASDRMVSMGAHTVHNPIIKIIDFDFMAIAACGAVRGLNIIEASLKPPVPLPDEDAYTYCITQLVPSLQETFKASNYSDFSLAGGEVGMHTALIVAIDGRLFEVGEDYAVLEYTDFVCQGSGTYYAYGALFALAAMKPDSTPEEKIAVSIGSAAFFDKNCNDEISIISKGKLTWRALQNSDIPKPKAKTTRKKSTKKAPPKKPKS